MIPDHLPKRLTISLWDFSWYTRAGEGEPFEDLGVAFTQAVERGYNTVRICAAPLLTFGELGLDPEIAISGMGRAPDGHIYGRGTRWYDVAGGYTLNVRERLLELMRLAQKHNIVVILASWEYQQSTAFAADPQWWNTIAAVAAEDRFDLLARSFDRMLREFETQGLLDSVALTELHNEVDFSHVPAVDENNGAGAAALDWLAARYPGQLVTASYGKPPHLDMGTVSPSLKVAQFHIYTYGVLDALQQEIDLRSDGTAGFPNAELRALLVDNAPSVDDYGRPDAWRFEATVVTGQMIYGYDFVDPAKWDAWLFERYPGYRLEMHLEMASRIQGVAAWSRARGIPQVVGEGWVGYTPLHGTFEESAVGLELAEHGIRTSLDAGVWGMVLCSNAAPHHPLWSNIVWQQRMNAEILAY